MSIRRNTIYGGLGFLVPTVVVFLAYPLLLHRIGAQAFGIYLLAVTTSGTLAFLELGFTTATVRYVAESVARRDPGSAADVVATSLLFYTGLGVVGGVTLVVLAPALARLAGAPPDLEPAAVVVFRLASIQFLLAYVGGVFLSVFKGLQRFEFPTALGSLQTVLTWGGGAAVLALTGGGIVRLMCVGLGASAVVCLLSWRLARSLCRRSGIALSSGRPRRTVFRTMFRFGIFMSVNGLASVLMNQLQSWIVAMALSPVAVTVWATALQIVTKIHALIGSMFEALMPLAAGLSRGREAGMLRELRSVYLKALSISFALSIGGSAALYVVAPPLIGLWLHSEIDAQVVMVTRVLCFGLAVSGATPVVYHLLNGIGRPGVNTAFFAVGPVLFYGLVLGMSVGGLDLLRFSVASSAVMFSSGLAYVLFCEYVVWRRWMPEHRARRQPGQAVV